jgi:hypothetical protein
VEAALQSLHYRACCAITGCVASSHAASVCYEASFRTFDEIARDEIVKVADILRRLPDGCANINVREQCFGPEWVARLFRDGVMPTAEMRTVITASGSISKRAPAAWPDANWNRAENSKEARNRTALRDVGMQLCYGGPGSKQRRGNKKNAIDTRRDDDALRPLPLIHPWAPHELAVFDTHVRFIRSAPGGLTKPEDFPANLPPEELAKFERANSERMAELRASCGDDAVYIFTDAARAEPLRRNPESERCAGAFVICHGQNPRIKTERIAQEHVAVSPIACIYSGELGAIAASLEYVLKNEKRVFSSKRKSKKQNNSNTDSNNATASTTPPMKRHLVLVTDSKSALHRRKGAWRCGRRQFCRFGPTRRQVRCSAARAAASPHREFDLLQQSQQHVHENNQNC